MAIGGNKACPYCAVVIPLQSNICIQCGKDLQDAYLVAFDGMLYGIVLGDVIRIHGLTLEKAQEMAELLNSIKDLGNR